MEIEVSATSGKRKNKFLSRFLIILSSVVVLTFIVLIARHFIFINFYSDISVSLMKKKWNARDYQGVYKISQNIIQNEPFNNTARIYSGYSGFYLALAETDTQESQNYLDSSIISLRIALQNAKKSTKPQISYMLGKLYYYKNVFSSYYYYADLAVKYLTDAVLRGYKDANDIAEYLGLSYAALGQVRESIQAFTEALLVRKTDFLLLSIAEQYYKNSQNELAEAYLYQIASDCKDENIVLKSKLLMADIGFSKGDIDEAQKNVLEALKIDENNADSYYKLGLIYERQGDFAKARSQWRKAIKINPAHQNALKKIAEYR